MYMEQLVAREMEYEQASESSAFELSASEPHAPESDTEDLVSKGVG